MVVDHPADTEVYVDERFPSRAGFAVQSLRNVRPVQRARDARGQDVTAIVAARDGRYLSTFDLGHYQGIASEHAVEFDLDASHTAAAPSGRTARERLVLIAQGWVYPTNSSINVAVGQGSRQRPRGVALEYQTADGRWILADADLGFPAGKNKTMVIDLAGIGDARRVRLRTNMEVYWDAIASATAADVSLQTVRLPAVTAELRYRGFSPTSSPRGDAPETPVYAPIAATGQRWRDLVGYYTRFGDVRELLTGVDDRYVIMNAGDELALQFRAPDAPQAGWVRDFVLIGDGWEKDGDFNTEFSATVLPLPAHGDAPYDASDQPADLEDDPVYRRHPGDWERYHTRYVRPDDFTRGLGRP
jgi:hypothetical protein